MREVAQIGPYAPPHGGVQSNLVAIRRYLQKQGIRSGVVNLSRNRLPPEEGVYYPGSAPGLLRVLLRLPHGILHVHFGGNLTARNLGLFYILTSLPGKKTVLSFHSGGFPSTAAGRNARPRSLLGFLFRRFDRIIAVNSQIEEVMLRFGVRPGRIRTIPPHAFDPAGKALSLPEPLHSFYRGHDPVLMTAGLLEPEYDLPMQIDALGVVLEQYPKAGLLLCGSGSLEGELRRQIDSRPWGEHILLAGDTSHGVVMLAMERARLLLRTTIYDGDAVSVREALYLGTPVIATDNGMRPPGPRLIPASDRERLIAAILKELRNPPPSRAAPAEACENLRAVLDLYRELE